MRVTVHGPNLRDQRKGQFHVHAADCGDNGKYGSRGQFGGEDNGWTIDASSRKEVVTTIYGPEEFGYDESEWRGYDDLWVAPCVTWEDEA